MSRRQAVICLAAGLVVLLAAFFVRGWLTPDPAGETVTDLNTAAAEALADPDAASAVAPDRVGTTTEPVPAPAPAEVPVGLPVPTPAPAAVAPVAAAGVPAPGAPVRLQLPGLGVDNPVIPIGVTAAGDLEIPADVEDIGWYRFGPEPGGAAGSAVLTGHVDYGDQGAGPFARLGELAEGDPVTVVDETGTVRAFTVLAREEWSKSEVPLDRIFDRGGSARLVLITCGGRFDAKSGHYEDNIAVTAVPAV